MVMVVVIYPHSLSVVLCINQGVLMDWGNVEDPNQQLAPDHADAI
jgi:hypothetical protein